MAGSRHECRLCCSSRRATLLGKGHGVMHRVIHARVWLDLTLRPAAAAGAMRSLQPALCSAHPRLLRHASTRASRSDGPDEATPNGETDRGRLCLRAPRPGREGSDDCQNWHPNDLSMNQLLHSAPCFRSPPCRTANGFESRLGSPVGPQRQPLSSATARRRLAAHRAPPRRRLPRAARPD